MQLLRDMSMLPAGVGSPVKETLQSIINYATEIKNKALSYSKIFEKSYPDINAFYTISNDMILVKEFLAYYYVRWHKEKEKEPEKEKLPTNQIFLMYSY